MYDYCDGSFIKMPSAKVAELANTKIRLIEKLRAEKVAKIIEQGRINMMKLTWWDRIWNTVKSRPTDEEVSRQYEIEAEDMWGYNPLKDAQNSYGDQYYTCRRLLRATQHAEEIYISTEDLGSIS